MFSIRILFPTQSGKRFILWEFSSLLIKQWQCAIRFFVQFDDSYVISIIHITRPRLGPVTFDSAERLQASISAESGQT